MDDYISHYVQSERTFTEDELKDLIERIKQEPPMFFAAPLEDMVKVVRCKDCKHRDVEEGFCKGRGWPMQLVPDDGFCDRGGAKNDG